MAKAKKKAAPRKRGAKARRVRIAKEAVFEHLKLKHIRLLDLQTHLEIHGGILPVRAKIESSAALLPAADGTLHVDTQINIEGRPPEDDGGQESSVATVNAKYQCVYEIIDDLKPETFQEHAELITVVGMQMAWPYLRELAHALTLRMAIPPFIIPALVPMGKSSHVVSTKVSKPASD